jgi:hypothetical protein
MITMKLAIIFGVLFLIIIGMLLVYKNKAEKNSDKDNFEEILNDPRVNSKKVGEQYGIKYFQIIKDGRTGFRDLNGNVVIEPKFDNAEMFSEGYSAVQMGELWGLIDETGKYKIKPSFEYLGSVHNGLLSNRLNDKYGFVDVSGKEKIKPQFEWVDEFSEGLCVVRNHKGQHGYIDTAGTLVIPFQFEYAIKFENGKGKVELNELWGAVDKSGKIVEKPTHKYATDW